MGPAGTVVILAHEAARYTRFWNSFLGLRLPPVKIISKLGVDVAKMRNEAIAEMEGDWIWFVDDDHTFEPDLLMKLLAHNVDVVQPLILRRYAPFGPVHMGPQVEGSQAHWQYALRKDDPKGLMEVHAVGSGCCLIKKKVLDAIERPWFEIGKLEADGLGEDLWFCRKVKEKGFRIFCDLGNPVGHLNVGNVVATRKEDGTWMTRVEFGNQYLEFPTAEPQFRIKDDGNVEKL